jgi:hypothetical protein
MKWCFVGVALLFATPAVCADFSAKIIDIDGHPIIDDLKCPADKDGKRTCSDELTLSTVSVRALLANFPDEQNLAGDEKLKRFVLASKIRDGGEVKLTAEEISLIKRLIGKAYVPTVVGRSYPLLDSGEK